MVRKVWFWFCALTLAVAAQDVRIVGVVAVDGQTLLGVHYIEQGQTLLFPVLDVASRLGHAARYDTSAHLLTWDEKSAEAQAVMLDNRPYVRWEDIARVVPGLHLQVSDGQASFDDRPFSAVATPEPRPTLVVVAPPPPPPPPRPRPAPTVTTAPPPKPAPSVTTAPGGVDLDAADRKMDAHDYAGALALYKQALAGPTADAQVMYKAGLAAYLAKQYDESVLYFNRYHDVQPDDWQGYSKLCQACEAAGHADAAESWAARLRTLWQDKSNAELSSKKSYVRDQFEQDGKRVMVFELFDPIQTTPTHVWDFVVLGADRKAEKVYYVQRDPTASENSASRDVHFYMLDETNRHTTFLSTPQRPSYQEAKKEMQYIMAGKVEPLSSTSR